MIILQLKMYKQAIIQSESNDSMLRKKEKLKKKYFHFIDKKY